MKLRLVKNLFAGPANQCYEVIIAELDLSPPGIAVAGLFFVVPVQKREARLRADGAGIHVGILTRDPESSPDLHRCIRRRLERKPKCLEEQLQSRTVHEEFGGWWTIQDCLKGLVSKDCGGEDPDDPENQKKYAWPPRRDGSR